MVQATNQQTGKNQVKKLTSSGKIGARGGGEWLIKTPTNNTFVHHTIEYHYINVCKSVRLES